MFANAREIDPTIYAFVSRAYTLNNIYCIKASRSGHFFFKFYIFFVYTKSFTPDEFYFLTRIYTIYMYIYR